MRERPQILTPWLLGVTVLSMTHCRLSQGLFRTSRLSSPLVRVDGGDNYEEGTRSVTNIEIVPFELGDVGDNAGGWAHDGSDDEAMDTEVTAENLSLIQ